MRILQTEIKWNGSWRRYAIGTEWCHYKRHALAVWLYDHDDWSQCVTGAEHMDRVTNKTSDGHRVALNYWLCSRSHKHQSEDLRMLCEPYVQLSCVQVLYAIQHFHHCTTCILLSIIPGVFNITWSIYNQGFLSLCEHFLCKGSLLCIYATYTSGFYLRVFYNVQGFPSQCELFVMCDGSMLYNIYTTLYNVTIVWRFVHWCIVWPLVN